MPLFKCTACGCIDNTACGGSYWHDRESAECAECYTGKWHGAFEKKTPEEAGLVLGDTPYDKANGFYKAKDPDKGADL